ncbi:SGNH/GDSL hydrolase family protein [Jeotgalibacillus proteolyticus]|uniref:SGNH/GDSL hydrolase family protein n=1 Tax=Jeotgalibacillus proteolyticus TaxID=2082395 RepID=UPI003CEA375A
MKMKILLVLSTFLLVAVALSGYLTYSTENAQAVDNAIEKLQEQKEKERQELITKYNEFRDSTDTGDFKRYETFGTEHTVFEDLLSGGRATIVFLGDSTTEQNDYTNGLPGHVEIISSKFHELFGFDVKVRNAGVSGNDLLAMQERVRNDVLRFSPELVVVNSSLNDVVNEVSLNQFRQNYQTLIDSIKDGSDAKIILRTSNYTMSPEINEQLENGYNDAIKEIAKDNDLGFIDLYSYYKDQAENSSIDQLNFNHFHPNETGQELIANSVLFALIEGSSDADF